MALIHSPAQVCRLKISSSGERLLNIRRSLCLALFLGAVDSSIVATALVTIGRDFNDFIQLQWIVLAYLLTYLGTEKDVISTQMIVNADSLHRLCFHIFSDKRCHWEEMGIYSCTMISQTDSIGRGNCSRHLQAVVILTASSLACGLSQTMTQLIVFRAFQGVGGSGVYSMPFTVLPEITPPKKFALLSGISGLTFTCSSVL